MCLEKFTIRLVVLVAKDHINTKLKFRATFDFLACTCIVVSIWRVGYGSGIIKQGGIKS